MILNSAEKFEHFCHQYPGSGFGSALTLNAGSGSALKPMRIHNTGYNAQQKATSVTQLSCVKIIAYCRHLALTSNDKANAFKMV